MHVGSDLSYYVHNLHLGRNIVYLYTNRLLIQIGSGMLTVFTAVFFFERFGEQFAPVALLYALAWGGTALLYPLSAQLLNHISLKVMLIGAMLFLPATVLSLLLWDFHWMLSVGLYLLFSTIFRLFYWVPYHIGIAQYTTKTERGKQLSFFANISEVILSLTPFFAGIVIATYGFDHIFVIASAFLLLAIFPLIFISDTREEFRYGFFETFKKLFSKEERPLLLAYAGDGIQSSTRIIVWPVFIFIILDGAYTAVGALTTLTIVVLIILRSVVGKLADTWDKKRLLHFTTIFSTTGWLFKVFIETGAQIFITDTYHQLGRSINRLSVDVVMYDHAADNGHYIDEYTVLREMALMGSRAVTMLLAIVIASVASLSVTFIIAAGATLLMNSINKEGLIR